MPTTDQKTLSDRWLQSREIHLRHLSELQTEAYGIVKQALEDCPIIVLGKPFPTVYTECEEHLDVKCAALVTLVRRGEEKGTYEAAVCFDQNSTEVSYLDLREADTKDWCAIADAIKTNSSPGCG